jgi:hypothetical protein
MPGFSGQGIVSLAPRLPSGLPGIFRDFGNAEIFELGLNEDSVERNEHMTGKRLPYRKLTRSRSGSLKLKGDEFNAKNFELAVVGLISAVAAGSAVTDFVLPSGIVVGDTVALPAKNVSAVSVEDSTSVTAKVLPEASYEVDPLSAEIKFLNLTTGGPYVQPFKANFTPGAHRAIGAFQGAAQEYFIRLKGINTDTNERGVCDVFRVKISPTKAIALINADFLDWELDMQILADLTRQSDAPGGQFFAWYDAA